MYWDEASRHTTYVQTEGNPRVANTRGSKFWRPEVLNLGIYKLN